ncbi:hypothetical protein [uncultured Helicobacter sp.]
MEILKNEKTQNLTQQILKNEQRQNLSNAEFTESTTHTIQAV